MLRRVAPFFGLMGICAVISAACQSGALSGSGGPTPSGPTPSPTPSLNPSAPKYYDNVLGIVYNHCMPCHTAGGLEGQFPLDTYASAQALAPLMSQYTAVPTPRIMPPWPPDPACGGVGYYQHERLLAAADVQTISDWYLGGSQAGNPANAPTPTPAPTPLPAPDVSLDPGAAYTFGGTSSPSDQYVCFRMLLGITSGSKDMIRATVTPGNTAIVHHIILYREPNGSGNPAGLMSSCGGIPTTGGSPDDFLVGWVPGAAPLEFPANTGMQLNSTDAIVMQVHYHNNGTQQTDHSSAAFWYAASPVANLATVIWAGPTQSINIPPNSTGVTFSNTCTLPSGGTLLSVSPHMHVHGSAYHADWIHGGTTTCLVDEKTWSFGWQGGYMFSQPKQLTAGDQITTKCTYFNDTNSAIGFGENTTDEMCFDFMYVVGWGSTQFACVSL